MRPGVGVIASRWPQISIYGACGSRYRWDIDGSFSISPRFSRFLFSKIIYTFSIIRCFHSPKGARRRNGTKETRTTSVLLHPEEFSREIHRFPFVSVTKVNSLAERLKPKRKRDLNNCKFFSKFYSRRFEKEKKKVCQIHSFLSFSYPSQNSSPSFQISLRNRSLESNKLTHVPSFLSSKKKEKSWPIRRHPLATQRVSYRFPKRNKAVSRGFQVALRKEFTFWKTFYNSPSFLPTASPFPFRKLLLASVQKLYPNFVSSSSLLLFRIPSRENSSLPLSIMVVGRPRARLPIDHPPIRPLHSASRDRNRGQPERSSPLSSPSSFPSGTPLKGVGFRGKPVENCRPQPATLWPPFIGLVRGGLSFMQSVSATWEELCGIPLTW